MCEHPFVISRAGTLFCEECGLFLPAYPEQMAQREAQRKEELRKAALSALDAPATAAKADFLDFSGYAAPLYHALYPKSFADEMVKVL